MRHVVMSCSPSGGTIPGACITDIQEQIDSANPNGRFKLSRLSIG